MKIRWTDLSNKQLAKIIKYIEADSLQNADKFAADVFVPLKNWKRIRAIILLTKTKHITTGLTGHLKYIIIGSSTALNLLRYSF